MPDEEPLRNGSASSSEGEDEDSDGTGPVAAALWEDRGFVQRSIAAIFDRLEEMHADNYEVSCSHLEIYNEEMFDLMNLSREDSYQRRGQRRPHAFGCSVRSTGYGLRLEEDMQGRVRCAGLTEVPCMSSHMATAVVRNSCRARATTATLSNERSSRSHSILTFNVLMRGQDERGMIVERLGQLSLVDLAGSECLKRSGAQGQTAREAATINQSLLTLGRVITALMSKQPHIPYRDSKLTRLLQDSLGGSSKTLIVATVSPLRSHLEETMSTLQYAVNAASIINKPCRNTRTSVSERIRALMEENRQLREEMLEMQQSGEVVSQDAVAALEDELADLKEHLRLMHQRLAIADERNGALARRLAEEESDGTNRDKRLEALQAERRAAKLECGELRKKLRRAEEEAQHLQAADSQLQDELLEGFRDLLEDEGWSRGVCETPSDAVGDSACAVGCASPSEPQSGSGISAAYIVMRALGLRLGVYVDESKRLHGELANARGAASEKEAALKQELEAAQEEVSKLASLKGSDVADLRRECGAFRARAAELEDVAKAHQAKLDQQRAVQERESARLQRTVANAMAEFARRLPAGSKAPEFSPETKVPNEEEEEEFEA